MSDAITKALTGIETNQGGSMEIERRDDEVSETSHFKLKADFFQTDTSEDEDLYDNAGADTTNNRPALIAPGVADPDRLEQGVPSGDQSGDVASVVTRVRLPKDTQTLSVPGRALLKKYFSEAPPIRLPIVLRTLALSEPQVHTLVKVISDEAVSSSLRAVQTLVSETLKAGDRMCSGGFGQGGTRPARIISESSGEDLSRGGHTTDDYSSGAVSSDDDFVERRAKLLPQESPIIQPTSSAPAIPGERVPRPGFTASD